MKKITTFLSIICFICIKCAAQTRLVPGEIKGKHDTFIVEELKPMDSIKSIVVYSKSNKYNSGIPRPKVKHVLPVNQTMDVHVDKDAIKQIIYTILNKKLGILKQNKEVMDVHLKFHPNGELTDIAFGLHENTLITLQDIEEIDEQLRSTIKATFTGRTYLQYEAIYYPVLPSFVF